MRKQPETICLRLAAHRGVPRWFHLDRTCRSPRLYLRRATMMPCFSILICADHSGRWIEANSISGQTKWGVDCPQTLEPISSTDMHIDGTTMANKLRLDNRWGCSVGHALP